jgi:hypothetical protein
LKKCTICGDEKPLAEFTTKKNKRGERVHASYCKPCIAKRVREKREQRYGDGQCATCGKPYKRQTANSRFCSSACAGKVYTVENRKTHCWKGHLQSEWRRPYGTAKALRCYKCHEEREEKRRRALGKAAIPTRKTGICVNGHPKTPENTRPGSEGRLRCKICERIRAKPQR